MSTRIVWDGVEATWDGEPAFWGTVARLITRLWRIAASDEPLTAQATDPRLSIPAADPILRVKG